MTEKVLVDKALLNVKELRAYLGLDVGKQHVWAEGC